MLHILLVIVLMGILSFLLFGRETKKKRKYNNFNSSQKLWSPEVQQQQPVAAQIEKEIVSIPQRLRRVQQYLNRKNNIISSNVKEMYHQQQVIDITSQLNQLNDRHAQIQDAAIAFKNERLDFDADKKSTELKNREDLVSIKEAGADLLKSKLDVYTDGVFNKIESKNLDLKEKGLKHIGMANDLAYKENQLKLIDQKLDLKKDAIVNSAKELSLQNLRDSIFNDQTKLELINEKIRVEKKDALVEIKHQQLDVTKGTISNMLGNLKNKEDGLRNIKDSISNDQVRLNLTGQENSLSIREGLNMLDKKDIQNKKDAVRNMEFGLGLIKKDIFLDIRDGIVKLKDKELDVKRGHLNNLSGSLNNKLGEIRNAEKNLKLNYKEYKLSLERTMIQIQAEYKKLTLARYENRLLYKEQSLKLFKENLFNAEQYINQMYRVKQHKLELQGRENRVQYREQQLSLDNKHSKIQESIGRLRNIRHENELKLRENRLELKNLLSDIKRSWLPW